MGDDEGQGGGEAVVAVEGAGLLGLLSDGTVEVFEEAGGPEEARLPRLATFAGPDQGIEMAEGGPEAAFERGDDLRLAALPVVRNTWRRRCASA